MQTVLVQAWNPSIQHLTYPGGRSGGDGLNLGVHSNNTNVGLNMYGAVDRGVNSR
jgi:hypothetical protein